MKLLSDGEIDEVLEWFRDEDTDSLHWGGFLTVCAQARLANRPAVEVDALGIARSALGQYGQHLPSCALMRQTGMCSCGLSQALGHMDLAEVTAWRWTKTALVPKPAEVKREGWLTRKQVEWTMNETAKGQPTQIQDPENLVILCSMALAAIDKGDK